jgi:hypothetical protein
MVIITEFYARYASTVAESELYSGAENLLKFAENAARDYYAERYDQLGITLTVRVEIGSTRTWITIKGLGKAFLVYAAIRQGIDYVITDSQMLARLVVPGIPAALNIPPEHPQYHARRQGVPGQLRRLFEKVERGELSPAEATNVAIDMFGKQEPDALRAFPDLKDRLSAEFSAAGQTVLQTKRETNLFHTDESTGGSGVPKGTPSPPRREPAIAPLPGTSSRRRRRLRIGVIAGRNPETGHVQVASY